MQVHTNILSKGQKKLLSKLQHLKNEGFYLAGGTGLALLLGHRTSADFDFYSQNAFDVKKVFSQIKQSVNTVQPIQIQEDTLILKCEGIMASFFVYPYSLLRPLVDLKEIFVASLEDIAAMKLVAIIQRGTKRDFIDVYYLIKKLGLDYMLKLSGEKYEEFNSYLALQSLLYFEDAEKEKLSHRKIKIKESLDWKNVKDYIIAEVKRVKEKI